MKINSGYQYPFMERYTVYANDAEHLEAKLTGPVLPEV